MTLSSCCGECRGDCSILVFRRCVADRRLSGVEQNFSARYSRKGKCEKAQYFAISHDRGPGTKRVVTAKPSSLDATPASTIVAARRANPATRRVVPNLASSTKPRGSELALFFLPHIHHCRPQSRLLALTGNSRGDCSMLVFRRCVADRRLSGVERNFSARYSRKGKCEKAQSFAISHDRGPGTKRVVTAKPSSLDATPASTIVAGWRANPARPSYCPESYIK